MPETDYRASARALPLRKLVIFSLLPALTLVAAGEIGARLLGLAVPSLKSIPLPEERFGIMVPDPDLLWALKPEQSLRLEFPWRPEPSIIHTNSLGLRSPEIGQRAENEYRILSLGESTTFGAFVSDEETYSARLDVLLDELDPSRDYRVINAGVPAYTSYQSLKYLETRGRALDPDMVLFYHEFNDYLPSSLRSSDNTEIGLGMTDRELLAARRSSIVRRIAAKSALVRLLSLRLARARFDAFRQRGPNDRADEIGLSGIDVIPAVTGTDGRTVDVDHDALPRRVSAEERRSTLADLATLCRENGIELVVIHPSYLFSGRHECLLTEFCRENGVAMFEAHDALHPDGVDGSRVFADVVHPTAEGHAMLAGALAPFLVEVVSDDD